MRPSRLLRLLVALAGVAAFTVGGFATSGATFVAHTASPGNSFSTYPDWVAPVVTIAAPADGARTASSTPAISGSAGILSGDLPTVTVKIYAGTLASGPVVQTRTALANAGTGAWTLNPTALADGTYTARAQQDDSFLNTGFSDPVTFTVDTVAPAPTITVPAAGATVAGGATISGAAGNATGDAPTLTVNVYAGGTATGVPVRTLTATRSGATWSVAISPTLGSGTFTARASQGDDVGHSGLSNARTFVVDATAPAPAITQPTANQWLTTQTPLIRGTAGNAAGDGATVTIKVYAGASATGTPVQTLSATRAGVNWSVTAAALADGQYTAQAIQSDAVGNVGTSAARSFYVDITTPVLSIAAPTANQRVGARPPISGTAGILLGDSANVTVRIYSGATTAGTLRQTLTAARNAITGAWTVTPATLADGQYTVQATQTDSAGHSGTSAPVTFIADGTAPAGVAITAPTAGQWLTTPAPTISGTAGNATGDDTTLTVSVYAGATATGTPVALLSAVRSGTTWTVPVAPPLVDGQYTAQAKQGDASGNLTTSAARSFFVDTTTPVVSIAAPSAGQHVGSRPPVSGTAGIIAGDSATVTVRIYAGAGTGGTLVQTLSAARNAGTGAWAVTPATLADGTYTVQATQTDSAGHSGTSAAITFVADGTAPAGVAITAPTANQSLPTAAPTITGTAGNQAGDNPTLTVSIYAGATPTGTAVRVLTATRSGTAWSVPVAPSLADGQYTVQAKQGDASGNTTTTTAVTFRTDTSAPAVTISAPAAGALVVGQPPISGVGGILVGDNALITVRIYIGATTAGAVVQTITTNRNAGTGAWTVTPAVLASGTYTATATQTDAAGNTGVSAPVTFTTDSVKPAAQALTTVNGAGPGHVAGRLDGGDAISFPYSEAMSATSILAGWDGTATPVNARFINTGANDGLTLLNAGATATLGIAGGTLTTSGVRFGVDLVSANVTFSATMTLSADKKTVTIVLGTPDAARRDQARAGRGLQQRLDDQHGRTRPRGQRGHRRDRERDRRRPRLLMRGSFDTRRLRRIANTTITVLVAMGLLLTAAYAATGSLPLGGMLRQDPQVRAAATQLEGPVQLADTSTVLFDAQRLQPGMVKIAQLRITNTGSTKGTFTFSPSSLTDTTAGLPEPLSAVLDLTMQDATNRFRPITLSVGKLRDLAPVDLGVFGPGEARTYRFTVSYPTGRTPAQDNPLQGASASVVFNWDAVLDDPPAANAPVPVSAAPAAVAAPPPVSGGPVTPPTTKPGAVAPASLRISWRSRKAGGGLTAIVVCRLTCFGTLSGSAAAGKAHATLKLAPADRLAAEGLAARLPAALRQGARGRDRGARHDQAGRRTRDAARAHERRHEPSHQHELHPAQAALAVPSRAAGRAGASRRRRAGTIPPRIIGFVSRRTNDHRSRHLHARRAAPRGEAPRRMGGPRDRHLQLRRRDLRDRGSLLARRRHARRRRARRGRVHRRMPPPRFRVRPAHREAPHAARVRSRGDLSRPRRGRAHQARG